MTIEEIQQLIQNGESRTLELKKSTGELKDAMHTACAFLNTEGGWLIFGVLPQSLKIVGQQVTDNTQQELAQALSFMEPALDIRIEYVEVPDSSKMKVIALSFDGWVWGKDPYTYHGCPYYKVESTTKVMPRDMFEDRLKAAKPHKLSWERLTVDNFKTSDLNEAHIMNAVRMGVRGGRMPASALSLPVEEILMKFIAETLYKCTWLESWGSGVGRMTDACRSHGIDEPFYELRPGGVAIVFKRKSIPIVDSGVDGDVDSQLTERQSAMLKILSMDGDTTAMQLARVFSVSKRTIDRELSYLRKNGYINKTSSDTRSPWEVLRH